MSKAYQPSEKPFIDDCLSQIIKKLNLDGENLSARDYEFLRQHILESTTVDLSTTTLRRVQSGRYQNVPQITTLNALAQTAGFDSWHQFKMSSEPEGLGPKRKRISKVWILGIVFLSLTTIAFWWVSTIPDRPTDVSFKAQTQLKQGVPSTIGFHYDIGGIEDDIQIQISWNPNERFVLDPELNFFTGTYFYPDYHEAKLLWNEEIIATQYVHIVTESWHGLVMKEGLDVNPVYIDEADFIRGDTMKVTEPLVSKIGVAPDKAYFPVFTCSHLDLNEIDGDNFKLSFESMLEKSPTQPNCRSIDVLVKGESGNMRIPLGLRGCYAMYRTTVSEKTISGRTNDLSSLSLNLDEATQVEIVNQDKKLTIEVGTQDIYTVEYEKNIGQVKVLKFVLTGPGWVKGVDFTANNQ